MAAGGNGAPPPRSPENISRTGTSSSGTGRPSTLLPTMSNPRSPPSVSPECGVWGGKAACWRARACNRQSGGQQARWWKHRTVWRNRLGPSHRHHTCQTDDIKVTQHSIFITVRCTQNKVEVKFSDGWETTTRRMDHYKVDGILPGRQNTTR